MAKTDDERMKDCQSSARNVRKTHSFALPRFCKRVCSFLQAAEGAELQALNAEADMPIEQLLALYKSMQDEEAEDKLSDSEADEFEPLVMEGNIVCLLKSKQDNTDCILMDAILAMYDCACSVIQ